MKRVLLLIAFCPVIPVFSQTGSGKKNLEKLCGCFEVEFKYAETFSPDRNYKFPERETITGGKELVLPVVWSDKKIMLQHLLVVSDSVIIKHWREEWSFENPVVWIYKGNKKWEKQILGKEAVSGKWTQAVWEVSDAPRYQGVAPWLDNDGSITWQSTADAPLPRREYTVRNDYNLMRRGNRIVISDTGWIHEQDNRKIIRTGTTDRLLVEEKGLNSYMRVPEGLCESARLFWKHNKTYWEKVSSTWEKYMSIHNTLQLRDEVEGIPLHQRLFELSASFASGKIAYPVLDQAIEGLIKTYIIE